MAELTDIREAVRRRYADAANAAASGGRDQARTLEAEAGCCGAEPMSCSPYDQTGVFGADMKVSLVNDGPITLILEI